MPAVNTSQEGQSYLRYWGKAMPPGPGSERYHLLAFHSLDVAACGQELLKLPRFGLGKMAADLGWSPEQLSRVFVLLLALHDVGKFSQGFQSLAKDLAEIASDALIRPRTTSCYKRHDTMGWALLAWFFLENDEFPTLRKEQVDQEVWLSWFRLIAGHHGLPPEQSGNDVERMFYPEDRQAAREFVADVFAFSHPEALPKTPDDVEPTMHRLTWRLAGIAVLADWIGSNAHWFRYQEKPQSLEDYWNSTAVPTAEKAVRAAGLQESPVRPWSGPKALINFTHFTPLQQYAMDVTLADGPQLFLLEDVTGAGKTEAALLLVHRLMAEGYASGLYFGLPTMATANQLYSRVKTVYDRLYEPGSSPSLVLSHGASRLSDDFQTTVVATQFETDFREDILQDGDLLPERQLAEKQEPPSSSAQCAAWLADSRKKSLLADVGVGTVDQAMLGVLPVRHQSLRLLGLAHKVLVVDEVHAYDAYTGGLLEELVKAQAMLGGSTILLSATVPAALRRKLVQAYQRGCGIKPTDVESDSRYPLATHADAGGSVSAGSFETRAELVRTVQVEFLHAEETAAELVLQAAEAGRCICWVRNTVEDARNAYDLLAQRLPADRLTLFHARFAMGDRLRIEKEVLRRFGKQSTAEVRRGQVLVATQVVEQSLDLDLDEMVSDLAPVDLLIQRVGRVHRHLRDAEGNPTPSATQDGRGPAGLHLLTPAFTDEPAADWYSALFPKAQYVYADTGKLWLTLKALREAGKIESPGEPGQQGSVRALVEAVYGENATVPDGLQSASNKAEGKGRSDRSQSRFNTLKLDQGYSVFASDLWHERVDTPTRLGEETETVYLAREQNGVLLPLVAGGRFPWEMSAVQLRAGLVTGLAPDWQARFDTVLQALRQKVHLLQELETLVIPLVQQGEHWISHCLSGKRGEVAVAYTSSSGLKVAEP